MLLRNNDELAKFLQAKVELSFSSRDGSHHPLNAQGNVRLNGAMIFVSESDYRPNNHRRLVSLIKRHTSRMEWTYNGIGTKTTYGANFMPTTDG
jgi:hypothetical protein